MAEELAGRHPEEGRAELPAGEAGLTAEVTLRDAQPSLAVAGGEEVEREGTGGGIGPPGGAAEEMEEQRCHLRIGNLFYINYFISIARAVPPVGERRQQECRGTQERRQGRTLSQQGGL